MGLCLDQAGGQRDEHTLALAVTEVAQAVSENNVGLTAPGDLTMMSLTNYSHAERMQLASEGKALPDGSFPIKTEEDYKNAPTLAKSHYGDWKAAVRLIGKRWP